MYAHSFVAIVGGGDGDGGGGVIVLVMLHIHIFCSCSSSFSSFLVPGSVCRIVFVYGCDQITSNTSV